MRRATYVKYKKDEKKWWIIPTILLVYFIPLIIKNDYLIYVLTLIGVTMIATIGLDIVTGLAGQISIGNGAFMAIGAYSYTLLSYSYPEMDIFFKIFIAGGFSGVMSLVLGFPALRVKGIYLALITMGFSICLEMLLNYFDNITGGPFGLAVPEATIRKLAFNTDVKKYYLIYSFVIIATITGRLILDSKIGRAFLGIRDNDIAAEVNGVNMILYRNLAFFIGSFYAGVSGALYAITLNFIDPSNFNILVSIDHLVILIVGGYGSIYGALIGSFLISWLTDIIKFVQNVIGMRGANELRLICYGFIILIFIVFEPIGCYGRWRIIRAYCKEFPLNKEQRKRVAWSRRWK